MSPSRGLNILIRARVSIPRQHGRSVSTGVANSMFVQKATAPTARTRSQIYISSSDNPYFNLSVEHYLLQNTHADSTILFLYINRPSVIIGRNQNPWVEVNQPELKKNYTKVDLVRRRSGGGTVFHDEGNVNYSVICPTAQFDRDKHAQMVVRALKKLGSDRVRVNERHDIVMDPKQEKDGPAKKISGSAYKLTRLRSLHHGTCLIRSPMLELIGGYLSSPAKPYITARGVDSVPSPVQNFGLVGTDEFIKAVTAEFQEMYDVTKPWYVDEKEQEVPEIKEGIIELKSKAWIYGQTPQFTFDINRTNTDSNPVHNFAVNFTARNMKFTDFNLSLSGHNIPPSLSTDITNSVLASPQRFYTIDWTTNLLAHAPETTPEDLTSASPTAKANADIRAALKYTGDMLNSYLGTKGGLYLLKGRVNDNEFQKTEMERISKEQEEERIAEAERLRIERERRAKEKEEQERGAREWREKLIAMRDLRYAMQKRNRSRRAMAWSLEANLAMGRRMKGLYNLIAPETKPTESKPTESKPTESKPTESKPTESESTGDEWHDKMNEIGAKLRAEAMKRWNISSEQRTKGLRGLKELRLPAKQKVSPVRLIVRGRKTKLPLDALSDLKGEKEDESGERQRRQEKIKEIVATYRELEASSEKRRDQSRRRSASGSALIALGRQEVKIVKSYRRKRQTGQASRMRRELRASGASGPGLWKEIKMKMKELEGKNEGLNESMSQIMYPNPGQYHLKMQRVEETSSSSSESESQTEKPDPEQKDLVMKKLREKGSSESENEIQISGPEQTELEIKNLNDKSSDEREMPDNGSELEKLKEKRSRESENQSANLDSEPDHSLPNSKSEGSRIQSLRPLRTRTQIRLRNQNRHQPNSRSER